MGSQGFRSIPNNLYVYQGMTGSSSSAIGWDALANTFKISVSTAEGALPSVGGQLVIDPAVAGNITITPNGAGLFIVGSTSYPKVTAKGDVLVASADNTIGVVAGATTAGHILTANGSGSAPTFQAAPAGVTYASDAETLAGTVTNKAVAPSNLKAKLGLQTVHALPVGNSDSLALDWLAVGGDGTVLIGNTGADPSFSANPTVTTIYATTFDTNVVAAGTTLSGTTLSADGTDADININITAKGAGKVIIDDLQLTTDLAVTEGGTGQSTLTAHGVLLGEGTSGIGATSAGTAGQILTSSGAASDPVWTTATYPATAAIGDVLVASAANTIGVVTGAATAGHVLMANGAGAAPTFQALPAAGIASVSGTANQITASTVAGAVTLSTPATFIAPGTIAATTTVTAGTNLVSTAGNLELPQTTATIGYVKMGGVRYLHSSGYSSNIFLGYEAGSTAGGNGYNIGIGYQCMKNSTSSINQNILIGGFSNIHSGVCNTMVGAGIPVYDGSYNVAMGTYIQATGKYSVGDIAGSATSNIIIQNPGQSADTNTIRIGNTGSGNGQQNRLFLAGAYGVTPAGTINVALVDSNGQFGSVASLGVANGGTGAATLTDHSVLLGSGTGAITPIAVGATGKYLRAATTADPGWSTLTLPDTVSKGDVLVASADNVVGVVTGAATADYVLTSNGAGSAPTFQAVPGTLKWASTASYNFTASSQRGYILTAYPYVNEITLPASPAVGDQVGLIKAFLFAQKFQVIPAGTSKIYFTLGKNSSTGYQTLSDTNYVKLVLTYIDTDKWWVTDQIGSLEKI